MTVPQELIGKTYSSPKPFEVTAETIRAYAAATGTDNPAYLEASAASGIVAPPVFSVVTSHLALRAAILDPALDIDMKRMLHAGQDMRFLSPIRPGDRLHGRCRVAGVEESRIGEEISLEVSSAREDGQEVYHGLVTLVVRGRRGERGAQGRDASRRDSSRGVTQLPPDAAPLFEVAIDVAPDQPERYADASGDRNPIHIDDAYARAAGLPGRILHGLCTLAMAQNALVDQVAGGDPRSLLELGCQFSRPVLPGDQLRIRAFALDDPTRQRTLHFQVLNPAGKTVLKEGRARFRDSGP